MCLKMSSGKWQPFCLGLNLLILTCKIMVQPWYTSAGICVFLVAYQSMEKKIMHVYIYSTVTKRDYSKCLSSIKKSLLTGFSGTSHIWHISLAMRPSVVHKLKGNVEKIWIIIKKYNKTICIQYIPRNMHTVLLCFALLWLCNRS